MKTQKFNVTGMTCAACQANVTRRVQKLEGVRDVDVNLLSGRMTVEYDESALTAPAICAAVQEIGYGASDAEAPSPGAQAQAASGFREEWQSRQQRAEDDQASMKRRLISSIILLIPLMYVAMGGMMGLPMPGFLTGMENALISALTQLVITVPVILINRLNRVIGQLGGIKKMVEEDRYCGDILMQVAAAESALQALGYVMLQDHMETCVVEEIQTGNTAIVDEAIELVKKLK